MSFNDDIYNSSPPAKRVKSDYPTTTTTDLTSNFGGGFSGINQGPSHNSQGGQQQQQILPPSSGDIGYWTEEDEKNFQAWLRPFDFVCKACISGKVRKYSTFGSLYGHFKMVHGLDITEYTEKFGCPKGEPFTCKICLKNPTNGKLKHRRTTCTYDKETILKHFKLVHKGLSLQQYYTEYVKKREGESCEQKGLTLEEWCSQRQYKCQLCKVQTRKHDYIFDHAKSSHGLNRVTYEVMYGTLDVPRHMCKICGRFVVQELKFLSNHFKEYHKDITAESYFNEQVKPFLR